MSTPQEKSKPDFAALVYGLRKPFPDILRHDDNQLNLTDGQAAAYLEEQFEKALDKRCDGLIATFKEASAHRERQFEVGQKALMDRVEKAEGALHQCYAATGHEAGDIDDFHALVDREKHTVDAVKELREISDKAEAELAENGRDINGLMEECAKEITLSNDFPWAEEIHCTLRALRDKIAAQHDELEQMRGIITRFTLSRLKDGVPMTSMDDIQACFKIADAYQNRDSK